jgi:putative phosphoesterase
VTATTSNERIIGVVSDTHGLLRAEAIHALRGSELILHAGDIGQAAVIDELERIAPVHVVRGNVDGERWAMGLPDRLPVEVDGVWMYLLHDVSMLDIEPRGSGFSVVVHGHSHKPRNEMRNGVLYFNPGSAGPRRFHLPVTVGRLVIRGGTVRGSIIELGA